MHHRLFAQFEDLSVEIWIGAVVGVIVLLIVVIWAVRLLGRKRKISLPPPIDLRIDVNSLSDQGPPAASPTLELYNIPVRLAAVIVAPAGRGSQLPAEHETSQLVDHIVPGLAEITRLHKPLVREWPSQLSTQGFSHTLFASVPLPGGHGKGTPWSVVAGRFESSTQSLLAGLVLRAATPNNLGQLEIERPGQWLDLLRVRRG
jgi:hypothetical protein